MISTCCIYSCTYQLLIVFSRPSHPTVTSPEPISDIDLTFLTTEEETPQEKEDNFFTTLQRTSSMAGKGLPWQRVVAMVMYGCHGDVCCRLSKCARQKQLSRNTNGSVCMNALCVSLCIVVARTQCHAHWEHPQA